MKTTVRSFFNYQATFGYLFVLKKKWKSPYSKFQSILSRDAHPSDPSEKPTGQTANLRAIPSVTTPTLISCLFVPFVVKKSFDRVPLMPATGNSYILELRQVSLSLQGKRILQDISFGLQAGCSYTLLGPNGAGKSTLLKCLNRIHRNWEGEILIDGQSIRKCSQREIARQIGFVPQQNNLTSNYHVHEFLLLNRFARHGAWAGLDQADREAVEFAVEKTDISEFLGRRMNSLSGGEAQKVFIAAALVQQTPILLLDEPTTFLDPRYQNEVNQLLNELSRNEHITMLQVSHDINSAARFSDRLLLMKNGRLIKEGTPDELLNPETMNTLFETEFLFLNHPSGRRIMV